MPKIACLSFLLLLRLHICHAMSLSTCGMPCWASQDYCHGVLKTRVCHWHWDLRVEEIHVLQKQLKPYFNFRLFCSFYWSDLNQSVRSHIVTKVFHPPWNSPPTCRSNWAEKNSKCGCKLKGPIFIRWSTRSSTFGDFVWSKMPSRRSWTWSLGPTWFVKGCQLRRASMALRHFEAVNGRQSEASASVRLANSQCNMLAFASARSILANGGLKKCVLSWLSHVWSTFCRTIAISSGHDTVVCCAYVEIAIFVVAKTKAEHGTCWTLVMDSISILWPKTLSISYRSYLVEMTDNAENENELVEEEEVTQIPGLLGGNTYCRCKTDEKVIA